MVKAKRLYYLRERYNPQLGTYWIRAGQLSKAAAKRWESTAYGENTMHGFETESEYEAKIAKLESDGEKVQ